MINGVSRSSGCPSYPKSVRGTQPGFGLSTEKTATQSKANKPNSTPSDGSYGLSIFGPNADDRVLQAWTDATDESGNNPYGMESDGKLSHLSVLFVMSAEKHLRTGNRDIMGDSVSSAISMAQQALRRLDDPAFSTQDKHSQDDRDFLTLFLHKLGVSKT